MARIIFKDKIEFIEYMDKFSGKERTMLLHVYDDNAIVLRPIVTSRIDTAIIYGLSPVDIKDVADRFTGKKFKVKSIIWSEDEIGGRR